MYDWEVMTDESDRKAISEEIDNATDRVKYELDFIKNLGSCLASGHDWEELPKSRVFPELTHTRKCKRCDAGQSYSADEKKWSETYWPDED